MKKIIMIALMAIVTCTAEAQNTLRENGTLTLQPKIGAGFGYLSGKFEMEPGGQRRIRTGIVLGVVTTVMKLNYINIPLVANFYVVKGFALKTGVQFGFLLTAKQNEDDWKSNAEKFNFAIPVGISYEFNNFVIDARYNFAVSPVNKVRNDDNRWRSDLMQLTLGYKFTL